MIADITGGNDAVLVAGIQGDHAIDSTVAKGQLLCCIQGGVAFNVGRMYGQTGIFDAELVTRQCIDDMAKITFVSECVKGFVETPTAGAAFFRHQVEIYFGEYGPHRGIDAGDGLQVIAEI
ncbi:hypothetical protein D3C73_1371390 [compost metagenome]